MGKCVIVINDVALKAIYFSKISWATTTTTHPPPTFKGEGGLLQQSAFSKNVLG